MLASGMVFFLTKKINQFQNLKDDSQSIAILQRQIGQLTQTIDRQMAETNRMVDQKLNQAHSLTRGQLEGNNRFVQDLSRESREILGQVSQQSQLMIRQVTEKLTKLDETNQRVVEFSSQLKNLQDILKNPKQRGILGEYYLEETLKNVLPPNSYQMQYKFKDGIIVDAVVFVKEKIIPVDSKFSLENYEQLLNCSDSDSRAEWEKRFKQDLKNRIDETAKYVKPGEKTVDFAFMFIPSESIYYDLLVNKVGTAQVSSRDLIDYAFKEKHVIIVSPTSFLAYLQTVLQGLRALEIEESAKKIQKNVERLEKHLRSYDNYHEKLGNSLATTVSHFNNSHREFKKIDKDILRITKSEEGLEIKDLEIEKPHLGMGENE